MSMLERTPYISDAEKITISGDMRAHFAATEMLRIQRYKLLRLELDKGEPDLEISVNDMQFMSYYFLDYFSHQDMVISEESYRQMAAMILAADINAVDLSSRLSIYPAALTMNMGGVDPELKRKLPQRDMYGQDFFNNELNDSFKELGSNSREAKIAIACILLGRLTFLLSKKDRSRSQDIFNMDTEGWIELIAKLKDLKSELEKEEGTKSIRDTITASLRLFSIKKLRTDAVTISTEQPITNKRSDEITRPKTEVERLFLMYRTKRRRFLGLPDADPKEHKESDADHISAMCMLAQYFLPMVNAELRAVGMTEFTLKEVNSIILAHDASEGITSDIASVNVNTDAERASKEEQEEIASKMLSANYLARGGGMNNRYTDIIAKYEVDKKSAKQSTDNKSKMSINVFVKALDVLEANMQIINVETSEKMKDGKLISKPLDKYTEENKAFISPFACIDAFNQKLLSLARKQGIFVSTQ